MHIVYFQDKKLNVGLSQATPMIERADHVE